MAYGKKKRAGRNVLQKSMFCVLAFVGPATASAQGFPACVSEPLYTSGGGFHLTHPGDEVSQTVDLSKRSLERRTHRPWSVVYRISVSFASSNGPAVVEVRGALRDAADAVLATGTASAASEGVGHAFLELKAEDLARAHRLDMGVKSISGQRVALPTVSAHRITCSQATADVDFD